MDQPTILLVEDDPDQAALFAQVLMAAGYTVISVPDAATAQAQLVAASVDLLLADWDLGGNMQGDALIRWTREHQPDIITALFSNHPQAGDYAAACGAHGWFRKMDGIARLRQFIRNLVPPTPA